MKYLLLTFLLLLPTSAFASTQVFASHSSFGAARNTTTNIPLNQVGVTNATNAPATDGIMAVPGNMQGFYAYVDTAPGGSGSWTAELVVNGSVTGASCTISGAATSCTDSSTGQSISAGDIVNVQFVNTGTPAASNLGFWIDFSPTTPGQTNLFIHSSATLSSTVANYNSLAWSAQNVSEGVAAMPIEGGTYKNLRLSLSSSIVSGNFLLALRNFSSNSTSTVTCTITATTCTDLTHTYATSSPAGSNFNDELDIASIPFAPSTSRTLGGGIEFDPTNTNDFPLLVRFATESNATRFFPVVGTIINPVATNASTTVVVDAMTITRMEVGITTPSAGTRTFTLQDNSSDTTATCTVAAAAQGCIWTGSLSIPQNDKLNMKEVAAGVTTSNGSVTLIANTPTVSPLAALLQTLFLVFGDW